ncbi:MAG: tyrosine-type recombinase/integrase [Bdellovibrionales bacterium]
MIQEYEKDGKVFYKVRVYVRSTENSDLRVTKQAGGFSSLVDAKKEEARLRKECERELHQVEVRGILWGDLLGEWHDHCLKTKVATGQRSKLNQDDYLGSLNKWFGTYTNKPVNELNPFVMAQIFEKMKSTGLCYGHRKKIKQFVKSVFDFGIQSGLVKGLQRSPTFDVVLGRDGEKKPEILTIVEIQKLIRLAYEFSHPWRRVWTVALMTGMRSGELLALTWKDVDFENRMMNVNKSHNCRLKTIKSTKAGYWRQVPISEDLERVLREQFEETQSEEHVFPRFWEWEKGLQAKILRAFCFIHGLPSIKFHTLRACFATQMLRMGVEPAKVMKICGWKELKTMQHYVRLAGIEVQGATEAMKVFPLKIRPQEASEEVLPSLVETKVAASGGTP